MPLHAEIIRAAVPAVLVLAGGAAMGAEPPPVDFAQIARGKAVYEQHCASCHGAKAEGEANWTERDEDGMFPAPPLNGTGHAWHHPHEVLAEHIANGGPPNASTMPAFGDTLSPQQIDDVIAWFQSLWPEKIYAGWHRRFGERAGGARK